MPIKRQYAWHLSPRRRTSMMLVKLGWAGVGHASLNHMMKSKQTYSSLIETRVLLMWSNYYFPV